MCVAFAVPLLVLSFEMHPGTAYVVGPVQRLNPSTWLAHLLPGQRIGHWAWVSRAGKKGSNLWPAPGSPGRRSCGVTSPALGCHRSFSGRFCCHRWLSHTPSFSRLRRHYGGLLSSDGPAGPPGAGCLLVSLSERAKDTPCASERKLALLKPEQVFFSHEVVAVINHTDLNEGIGKGEKAHVYSPKFYCLYLLYYRLIKIQMHFLTS